MKAVVLRHTGGLETLAQEDVPVPIPKEDEVLVKINSSGINFADVMIRNGTYIKMPEMPYIPGFDFSGTVEALGDQVRHISIGDRVTAMALGGGYAEYAIAHSSMTIPIPNDVTYPVACALPLSGMTAYHLTHSLISPRINETALVYAAAGSIGCFLIQLLKIRGVRVIALVGREDKAALALKLGAYYVMPYSNDDYVERIMELTAGHGVNYIFNSTGGRTLVNDFKLVSNFGTIVFFGQAEGPPNPKQLYVSMMRAFTKSVTFKTYYLMTSLIEHQKEHQEGWMRMFVWLQNDQLQAPVYHSYTLDNVAAAHQAVETRQTMGKVVLKP